MKHIVRKAYFDYEKEEAWLNEMSAKGFVLTDYSWCRYVFEEGNRNEYIYRLELLENLPTHPESIAYLRFLEENGVEVVSSYLRWVYLRKKSKDGSFDLYSDSTSKIKHYQRIWTLWTVFMCLEFAAAAGNFIAYANSAGVSGNGPSANLVLALILAGLGFLFLKLGLPLRKKIKKLKRESIIIE